MKATWEKGGDEMCVNSDEMCVNKGEEEEEEEEFGYCLSPLQFDSAMEDCSQKGRSGVILVVAPAPKKSKPMHTPNEDNVMGDVV